MADEENPPREGRSEPEAERTTENPVKPITTSQESLEDLLQRAVKEMASLPTDESSLGAVQEKVRLFHLGNYEREKELGITEHVNKVELGLSAVFKQRYTDFLVNEVQLSGEVLHLQTIPESVMAGNASLAKQPAVKSEDGSQLAKNSESTTSQVNIAREEDDTKMEISPPENSDGQPLVADGEASQDAMSSVAALSPEAEAALTALVGKETTESIYRLSVDSAGASRQQLRELNPVVCPKQEKEDRKSLHQAIRTIFEGRLASDFDTKTGSIVVTAQQPGGDRRDKKRARDGGQQDDVKRQRRDSAANEDPQARWRGNRAGEYLHFTLYKVNKDAQDIIFRLCDRRSAASAKVKDFAFGGTKDRRGVTVQRMSARRVNMAALCRAAMSAQNWVIGDLKYEKDGLALGDQGGNEFTITLRDVKIGDQNLARWATNSNTTARLIEQAVREAASSLRDKGFINYFGRQRFGAYSTKNHSVGIHMLREDYKSAVESILHYDEKALKAANDKAFAEENKISQDDANRALGISLCMQGKYHQGLNKLRMSSPERIILQALSGKNKEKDYQGALSRLPRTNRTMYVHAYQSLVWNLAAGHRWKSHEDKVVAGDLVLEHEIRAKRQHQQKSNGKTEPAQEEEEVELDQDGEVVVKPVDDGVDADADDMFVRARPLTEEEAASGEFSIYDVVLPLPGFDIKYPEHMKGFYFNTMQEEVHGKLNPFEMRRRWKEISLPGSYRKLLTRPDDGVMEVDVREYTDEAEQFVETDADRIERELGTRIEPLRRLKGGSEPQEKPQEKANQDWADLAEADDGNVLENNVSGEEKAAGRKVAVILKFRLGTGSYATMALRELMKGGLVDFQTKYSGGR